MLHIPELRTLVAMPLGTGDNKLIYLFPGSFHALALV